MHIRTHAMHIATQHGIATRWLERAEAGERMSVTSTLWLAHLPEWVSQLGRWQDELRLSAAEFVDALRGEVLEDQIFIFTPKGDVRELALGATVLDLAYQIHSDIGSHATGAMIQRNGPQGVLIAREVGLDYTLRTGDIVRVLTSAQAVPQPEWLAIVATRTARERINRFLRSQQRANTAAPPGERRARNRYGILPGGQRRYSLPAAASHAPAMRFSASPTVAAVSRCIAPVAAPCA